MARKILAAVMTLALVLAVALPGLAAFAPVPKDDLKVGFIYIGDVVDKGYTYAHHQGTLAMKAALGLTDDQVLIKTNVPEDSACEAAIRELVDAGCQIIFGNSYGYMDIFEEMAKEYPNVIFSHCSGYKSNDVNFNNYFGTMYQARYLTGIAAGLKTQSKKIGYVAAYSTPEVDGGCDAFALGVQSVNPDAVVYIKYMNTWYDPTLERQTAEALLDLGCDVIAQHCDTSMPQIAAQERGVWSVGYNSDMTADAPNAFLTAPVWNWGVVVTKQVQEVIDGTWAPTNILWGMKEGLVDISPLSANCAPGTQEAIDAAKAKILSGEFGIFVGPIYDNQGNLQVKEGETLSPDYVAFQINWLVKGVEKQ